MTKEQEKTMELHNTRVNFEINSTAKAVQSQLDAIEEVLYKIDDDDRAQQYAGVIVDLLIYLTKKNGVSKKECLERACNIIDMANSPIDE